MKSLRDSFMAVVILVPWILTTAVGISFAISAWTGWSDSNFLVRAIVALFSFGLGESIFGWVVSIAIAAFGAALNRIAVEDHRPLGEGTFAWVCSILVWLGGGTLVAGTTFFVIIGGAGSFGVIALGVIEFIAFWAAIGFLPALCSAAVAGERRALFWVLHVSSLAIYVLVGSIRVVLEPDQTFSGLPLSVLIRLIICGAIFVPLAMLARWRYRRERRAKLRPAIEGLRAKKDLRGELTAREEASLDRLTTEYLETFPAPPAA